MHDRKKQKLLRKLKEKGLSSKYETGLLEPKPFEAMKRIIEKEKKEIAEGKLDGDLDSGIRITVVYIYRMCIARHTQEKQSDERFSKRSPI